jgi:lactoylglutathione lyase
MQCCPSARTFLAVGVMLAGAAAAIGWAESESPKRDFTNQTIDIGMVVGDVEKSVDFYKNAIGFTELDGFDVPAEFAGDVGLTKNLPFHVHVLVLGDEKNATKLKLIQFADAPAKKIDNSFIHSSQGVRYLTIWVADTAAALDRAKQAGAVPLAKGLTTLPPAFPQDMGLACVKDPDGNIIELVGPKE